MRCSRARTLMVRRMDGRPTGLFGWRLDAHLARCRDCRQWAGAQEDLLARLAEALPVPEASWHLEEVWGAVAFGRTAHAPTREWFRDFWLWQPRPVVLAATVVVVVGVAFGLGAWMGGAIRHVRPVVTCSEVVESLGEFPAGSPASGLVEMVDRHLVPASSRRRPR